MHLKSLFFMILVLIIPLLHAQTLVEKGHFGGKGKEPGKLNNPLALDISKDGIVYVVDSGNNRIQLFDLQGNFKRNIGGFGFENDQFDGPRDIWVHSVINIYVSDFNNERIQRYDHNMNFISTLVSNDADDPEYQFSEVASCAVTSQNDLYLVDHQEFKIIKFNRDSKPEHSFGRFNSGPGELDLPEQIDLLGSDKLIVADAGAGSLVIFDLFGNFVSEIKNPEFKQPRGLAVDSKKNIYVADPQAKRVFRISADLKNISAIRFALKFSSPQDVAVLERNNSTMLYVIDGNEVIIGMLQD